MKFTIAPAAAVITAAAVLVPAAGAGSAVELSASAASPRAVVSDVAAARAAATGSMFVASDLGRSAPLVATVTNTRDASAPVALALKAAGAAKVSNAAWQWHDVYEVFRELFAGDDSIPALPKLLATGEVAGVVFATAVAAGRLHVLFDPAQDPNAVENWFKTNRGKFTLSAVDVIGLPVQMTTAVLVAIHDVIVSLPEVFAASNTAAGRWNAFTDAVQKARKKLDAAVQLNLDFSVRALPRHWAALRAEVADQASRTGASAGSEAAESASSGDRAPRSRARRSAEPAASVPAPFTGPRVAALTVPTTGPASTLPTLPGDSFRHSRGGQFLIGSLNLIALPFTTTYAALKYAAGVIGDVVKAMNTARAAQAQGEEVPPWQAVYQLLREISKDDLQKTVDGLVQDSVGKLRWAVSPRTSPAPATSGAPSSEAPTSVLADLEKTPAAGDATDNSSVSTGAADKSAADTSAADRDSGTDSAGEKPESTPTPAAQRSTAPAVPARTATETDAAPQPKPATSAPTADSSATAATAATAAEKSETAGAASESGTGAESGAVE